MAKKQTPKADYLRSEYEELYDKIKKAVEFKSMDNPEVKLEVMNLISEHYGEALPDDEA